MHDSPLMIVRIAPEVHRRNRALTKKMVEYGGTFKWSNVGKEYIHDTLRSGQYNSVAIPEGEVQFHTHPSKCKDDVCAMGVPSIKDLFGYAEAVMKGETKVHCIYSKEGTYCIMLRPEIRRALKDPRFRKIWRDTAESNLADFRSKQDITAATYDKFKRSWTNLARGQGFEINFKPIADESSTFEFTPEGDTSDPTSSYEEYARRMGTIPEHRLLEALDKSQQSLASELDVPVDKERWARDMEKYSETAQLVEDYWKDDKPKAPVLPLVGEKERVAGYWDEPPVYQSPDPSAPPAYDEYYADLVPRGEPTFNGWFLRQMNPSHCHNNSPPPLPRRRIHFFPPSLQP